MCALALACWKAWNHAVYGRHEHPYSAHPTSFVMIVGAMLVSGQKTRVHQGMQINPLEGLASQLESGSLSSSDDGNVSVRSAVGYMFY